MSSRVGALIVFGITLVVGGMYWALWDGSRDFLDSFVIEDAYYTLISWGWRMIPVVIMFIGIMCLIGAGISAHRTRVVET